MGHIQIQNVDFQHQESSSLDSSEETDQPQESADQLEQSDEEAQVSSSRSQCME